MRLKFVFYVIGFFLFSSFAFGQDLPTKIDDKSGEIKQTTKIDEFGDISEREFAPKLKNFIEILKKNKTSSGLVIFYNDFNSTPFKKTDYFATAKLNLYAKYLDRPYLDYPKISYMAGGLKEKVTTEFWLVPVGGESPKISSTLNYLKNEKYKLDRLDTKYLPLRILFDDVEKNIELTEEIDTGENPLVTKLLKQFYADPDEFFEIYTKELIEVLSQNETWQAKIFFYADKDKFDIETLQNFIQNQLKINFEKSDSDLNQVKIIYGGYRSHPQIDTWIIPKNGIEPEAMPDEKIEEN